MDEMVQCICKEIEFQKDYLAGELVSTIYFGGGTPSLLSDAHLDQIINTIARIFVVSDVQEFTIEINPEDVSREKLKSWENFGINRISMGIQSFEDEILKYLNRAHTSDTARHALHLLSGSAISNFSIDLIYGIPSAPENRWENDLQTAVDFNPQHISAYALTIEPRTVLGNWLKKGKLKPLDDEIVATEFELLHAYLEQENYIHYEVSNFAKRGCESQHNKSYWSHVKYLGIGPSAHSFDHESRQFNIMSNARYIKSIKEGEVPFAREVLTREEKVNDYLLTSLRTIEGASFDKIMNEWSYDIYKEHEQYLIDLSKEGLGEINKNLLLLTPSGFLLADKIASDLFL